MIKVEKGPYDSQVSYAIVHLLQSGRNMYDIWIIICIIAEMKLNVILYPYLSHHLPKNGRVKAGIRYGATINADDEAYV